MPWASWSDGSLPRQVIIVRALPGLGDLLCIVPALRALRAALPEATIDLLGLPPALEFVHRFSIYVDHLIEFPGFPGIPERPPVVRHLPSFLADIHQKRYDLALQMHGNGMVSNLFTLLLGARYSAGFYLPSLYCPDPERFLPYPTDEPEVRRHLRLMSFLGVPLKGEDLEFPLSERDWESLSRIAAAQGIVPGEYVCVHPGASLSSRRWSPVNFAAVADTLAARGFQIVLTGVKAETETTRAVADEMTSLAVDLTGQTDIGSLALLYSRARLVICNDTGVSHLAAAVGTPSVVIFVVSDPERWAPLDGRLHRVVGRLPRQAHSGHCPDALNQRCLSEACMSLGAGLGSQRELATPARVLEEAESLLDMVPNERKVEWLL